MKHYAVRKAELIYVQAGLGRVLSETLAVFRSAVRYLGNVMLDHWDEVSSAPSGERKKVVEALVHKTKDNPSPLYIDFDRLFYKFPSYYRRAAIEFAYGQISSWKTRLGEYEEEKHEAMSNGRHFRKKPPRLNLDTNACPTLYRKNMFKVEDGKVMVKAYIRNTWDWVAVGIPSRDMKSIAKAIEAGGKPACPMLGYRFHKFYLTFPFSFPYREFDETPLPDRKVLGVDLGINNGAVCSVVDANGKVHARAFDPFASKRAVINSLLARIRILQKKSGAESLAALYTKLEGVKDDYACHLAHWIVERARENGVYGIILEHLGKMKGRGRHKDRIHHWCKKRVAALVKCMALRYGIRTFFINPRNTSALAYDGSGPVTRDSHNFSSCTFASGKRYHCDLSASYNIAARYFLRAVQNAMPPEAWAQLTAKVPELAKRTSCTLSTLWHAAGLWPAYLAE